MKMRVNDWFYIEPYIIVESKNDHLILINSLVGSFKVFKCSAILNKLIDKLLKKENNYCIRIENEYLKDNKTKSFLIKIKQHYYGDIVNSDLISSKPFIPFSIKNYQKDETKVGEESSIHGKDIMLELKEFTLFVNSGCDQKCKLCNTSYKQCLFCTTRFKEELPIEKIKKFLSQLPSKNAIGQVNVIGANILKYKQLIELNNLLVISRLFTGYHIHYLNIDYESDETLEILKKLNKIELLLSFPFNFERLDKLISRSWERGINYSYKVSIENEKQYAQVEEYMDKKQIDGFEIVPIYNSQNISFFRKYLFTRKKNLESKRASKKQYYTNQTFNINNYGKIIIISNGDIYANINHPKLGNISTDSLYDILYSEIYRGKSWNLIRNISPCDECVFQYICPPISNYELVIGKYNLCHIRP